eukprot:snap_masked-scaffold_4-processed-gene-6.24-mRNA-1 protein AED:1.00 eAED:1.00 QI:0/0/0/0/1/1/6/0/121
MRIAELMNQEKILKGERSKIERIFELIRLGQIVLEDMPCRASGVHSAENLEEKNNSLVTVRSRKLNSLYILPEIEFLVYKTSHFFSVLIPLVGLIGHSSRIDIILEKTLYMRALFNKRKEL